MACRMALNKTSSPNGFVKNSTAPPFIAWTVIGTSPWPVMKMMGISGRSAETRFRRDALLYVEAIKAWKPDVEHEAARRQDARTREEFLCGLKGLRLPPGVTNQELQRLTHRDVVVHDEHCRGWVSSFQARH